MKLKDIAVDNLKRRKSKMIFLILGMLIGIATIVTIYKTTRNLQADIDKKIDEFGANIMIVPKSNTLSMSYGGITIPGAQYDLQEIREKELDNIWTIQNNENLSIVSPKLLGAAMVDMELVLIVGADLATEIKLKKWWKFTDESDIELTRVEKDSPVDPSRKIIVTAIKGLRENDVLLGHKVAEKLGKKPGQTLILKRNEIEMKAVIKAVIIETGSQDDSIVFMNLNAAQGLLGKEEKITLVEVAALCAGCPVEEMARQINVAIPNGKATPIKQVVEQKMQTINQLTSFGIGLGVIILIIGSLIVFTTMMAQVNERTREIGIFRAIGFRKMHIVKIILIEASLLSFIAGILGYVTGLLVSLIVSKAMGSEAISLLFDPYSGISALVLALLVGTCATIYPALRASNIDPADALRHI